MKDKKAFMALAIVAATLVLALSPFAAIAMMSDGSGNAFVILPLTIVESMALIGLVASSPHDGAKSQHPRGFLGNVRSSVFRNLNQILLQSTIASPTFHRLAHYEVPLAAGSEGTSLAAGRTWARAAINPSLGRGKYFKALFIASLVAFGVFVVSSIAILQSASAS